MGGYQLDVVFGDAARAQGFLRDAGSLEAEISSLLGAPVVKPLARVACVVEPLPQGARLVGASGRDALDEHAIECAAFALAGPAGRVFDRHAGRAWEHAVLAQWLRVAGLLSGRALAINEGRIAHRAAGVSEAAGAFGERATRLVEAARSGALSEATRARLADELRHWSGRPALAWACGAALAGLGDYARLEALGRGEEAERAFTAAAVYGAEALEFFGSALDDADPSHRKAAALSLHRVRDSRVLSLVVRALSDKRSSVREAVFEGDFDALLALEGAREELGPVLARLSSDPSSMVRKALARFGG